MGFYGDLMEFYGDIMEFYGILWWLNGIYPLVNIQKAIENGMAIEIVDLPMKNADFS